MLNLFKKIKQYYSLHSKIQRELLKHLGNKSEVYFIQVGSNDGKTGDPLRKLIINNECWKGIFIEPVDYLHKKLKANYICQNRFVFEKVAIGPHKSKANFYYVSKEAKSNFEGDLPEWYDQLGSFDKNHILKHLDGLLEPYIRTKNIEVVSLQSIIDKHGVDSVDLLHIDAEGYDCQVLSTINFEQNKPSVILYENKHLSIGEKASAESTLTSNNYDLINFGADTMAVYKK